MQTKIKLSVVVLLIATILLSSCAILGGGKKSSPGYTSGESFGSTLLSLYRQYKDNGKIDFTSASTLLSLTSLATNSSKIKDNWTDKAFYADFASGVIVGSQKKVTNSTVDNVISTVTGLDLGSILGSFIGGEGQQDTQKAPPESSTSGIISALSGLFSSFED